MIRVFVVCFLVMFFCESALAGPIPPGQDIGSRAGRYIHEKQREKAKKRLQEPKVKAPALDEAEIESLPGGMDVMYVRQISVQRDRFAKKTVKKDELRKMIRPYKKKMLSLKDIKGIASLINEKFHHKGVKAYIPKQSFSRGFMYINLIKQK